jgi:hypothetical protein
MPSLKSAIGDSKHISLDDVCFLLSVTTTEDDLGQPIETETPRQVFCSRLSITRTEYSAAGQFGHKPQKVLLVDSDEYDQENRLSYENTNFSIYKDFMRPDGYTELYCEVKAGG